MILITSAKYSLPDFSLEFGEIPPSFLPLGNRRLYEYQINLFKRIGQKIVLSLPKNFAINNFDSKKLQSLGVEVLFVPEGLSLGESVVYCLNVLCEFDEILYIIHGDTFFGELDLCLDSLHVVEVKDSYNWAFLDANFRISNENLYRENLILAGAYCVANPRLLIKSIVENAYSFIKGLQSYSQVNPFAIIENTTWLDFGLITSYFHSKKVVSTQRTFNKMLIDDNGMGGGYIHKDSQWKNKIDSEKFWFENLPRELLIYTPRFFKDANGYKVEYLYNNTLAELFVFGNLPSYTWKRIFESLKEFLKLLHSFKSDDILLDFDYRAKTLQRLGIFAEQSGASLEENWKINNIEYPSLLELVRLLDDHLQGNIDFSIIHGDFCFSNIMYDFRANAIKTFDPRGMDFSEKTSLYGDCRYDFAKLLHSVFGLYDFIVAGFFGCNFKNNEIVFQIEKDEKIKKVQDVFIEVFGEDMQNYAIMIHLFLSMLPLHSDSRERQMAFIANAFRLYEDFFGRKK